MSDINDVKEKLIAFREARDWKQFHKPKDLALSLVLESAEVLEHFQWKSTKEIEEYVKTHKHDIAEELADVFNWVILLSHDLDIDIIDAANKKIEQNDKKYPAEKAKGSAKKYTHYQS